MIMFSTTGAYLSAQGLQVAGIVTCGSAIYENVTFQKVGTSLDFDIQICSHPADKKQHISDYLTARTACTERGLHVFVLQ